MAGAFDQLPQCSFFGIPFAASRWSVKGGLRDHVHEYRHTPGGQPEKLGRKLYTFEFDAVFSTETPAYPNAWPTELANLRLLFEQEVSGDLVVPNLGTIRAYCVDWPTEIDTRTMRDGERAKLVFREDSELAIAFEDVVRVQVATVKAKSDALMLEVEDAGLEADLFQSIADAANAIQGYADQVELQGELLADKVGQVTAACQRLDETLDVLDEPPHYKVVAALHELGVAAIELQNDVLVKAVPIVEFVTPIAMTISDVATSIYGDASRGMEILKLNAISDPFSIPAGTTLSVYAK